MSTIPVSPSKLGSKCLSLSSPYSVKTNSRYLPDMPASASAGTLLLLPAAQVGVHGRSELTFACPSFPNRTTACCREQRMA
ncbi:hypothetical protein ACRRTK_020534 [Alexandromys fortis]